MLVFVPLLLVVERTVARRIFTRMRRAGQICRPILIVGTDADAIGLLHAAQRSPRPRLSGRRVRRRRRHRRRAAACSRARRHRRDPGRARGHRCDRRADLAVVRRVRGRQPAHPRAHRRRLPRRPVVRAARHRRRALPGPGPRRAHADLRRADPARRLARRRQADLRHRRGRSWPSSFSAPITLLAAHRRQADVARAGDLRPGARRPRRAAVPHLQVPHDGRRRRRPQGRAARRNEADGPMFKMANDPRVTQVGALAAQALDRRDPAVRQRPAGRDERRRTSPGPAERGRAVDRGRPRPPAGAAGHHRDVAGLGPFGHHVRRVQAPRPVLRRQLVAGPRPAHRASAPCSAVLARHGAR